MRAVVTGGAGFIGSHVADALLGQGEVLVLDNLSTGALHNVPRGAVFARADIRDAGTAAAIISSFAPDVVVHLAAQTNVAASVADPALDAAVNACGTVSVLEAARASGCTKFILASSSTVYGVPARQPVREEDGLQPVSPYGVSKLAAEHYVRVLAATNGMAYTVLRLGNVFGPRDTLETHHAVTAFMHALISGARPVIEWDGEQRKDYVYVGDVAAAVVAATRLGDDRVFNIASGQAISVARLLELVGAVLGVSPQPVHAPKRPGDVREYVMDCSAAAHALGWRASTPLIEALAATGAWFRATVSAPSLGAPVAG